MEELRLPRSNAEGLLYGGVIALITAFLMSTMNIAQNKGELNMDVLTTSLMCLPILWIIVMLLMTFVVGRIANYGVNKFIEPTDGFNTRIVFNIIFCVTMMSASMSIIGPLVGEILSGNITFACVEEWVHRWPTNFCIAFWIEMLIAQPVARFVMKKLHLRQISVKTKGGAVSE